MTRSELFSTHSYSVTRSKRHAMGIIDENMPDPYAPESSSTPPDGDSLNPSGQPGAVSVHAPASAVSEALGPSRLGNSSSSSVAPLSISHGTGSVNGVGAGPGGGGKGGEYHERQGLLSEHRH